MTDRYDIVVIGAGVAGAAFAAAAASAGRHVLLIERSSWPREKVCGGCLNAAALATLGRLGLIDGLPGARIDRVDLRCLSRRASVATPPGLALLRSTLDAHLVSQACQRGVDFLSGTPGVVCGDRKSGWRVRFGGERVGTVSAALIVAADGVGGTSLRDLPLRTHTSRTSRFGVSAVVAPGGLRLAPGVVNMYIGAKGYVGAVRFSDGRAGIAAALDPAWTKKTGGPDAAVRAVLNECGEIWVGPATLGCHGTGLMTRRRTPVALPGLLLLGDTAGFVEPFTGEGMAWALAGAEAAADMVKAGTAGVALAEAWQAWHARRIRPRQLVCAGLRMAVRAPWLAGGVVRTLAGVPVADRVAAGLARSLVRPYDVDAGYSGATQ